MKQYFKYLSFCVLAGVGLSSCDTDDNGYRDEPRDLGAYAYLSDRSISILDQNESLSIDLMSTEGVEFESVAIEDGDGNQIATASISGDVATFNASDLGEFRFGENNDELTGSFPLRIVSTLTNGVVLEDPVSVGVVHAVQLDELEEVTFMDPTSNEDVDTALDYSIFTHSAQVDDFSLEWKVGEEGEYQEDENVELDPESGEIEFSDLSYVEDYGVQEGDTLYYRFTASSGDLTDQVETSVIFVPQPFTTSASGVISNDESMSQYSFATGTNYGAESPDGEVIFSGDLNAPGFEAVNESDIEFVEVADDQEIDGVLDAREAFDAGTPQSEITGVENGDVYVYRVTRQVEEEEGVSEDVVHYGVITIGNVTQVNGTTVNFDVEATEGVVAPVPAE